MFEQTAKNASQGSGMAICAYGDSIYGLHEQIITDCNLDEDKSRNNTCFDNHIVHLSVKDQIAISDSLLEQTVKQPNSFIKSIGNEYKNRVCVKN